MGYTHYWRRPRILAAAPFKQVLADTRIIVAALREYGIQLAGPHGTGEPILKPNVISLNGKTDCGHTANPSIVIPWPADGAGGVAEAGQDATDGKWFAGVTLVTRICNGSCDYETFEIPRVLKPQHWQQKDEDGLYFDFCKTAFRPYDLAVIAILVSFKKHFGEAVKVLSDGTDQQWFDGKLLCSKLLDFGFEFEFGKDGELSRKTIQYTDAEVAKSNECEAAS